MSQNEENNVKSVRTSSAYTRVVGTDVLNVYNTKQTPGLPKNAYNKKWVVIQQTGKRNIIVGSTDKKYDSIDILLTTEKKLKAEAAKKAAENDL